MGQYGVVLLGCDGLFDRPAVLQRSGTSGMRPGDADADELIQDGAILMTSTRATAFDLREFQVGDGDALRALWLAAGFRLLGDDDEGLETFAERNPGLFLVATAAGGAIVGSAMGAWDGRRGWIYHVATSATYRRAGVASALVTRIEGRLAELGVVRVNVLVREGNDRGRAFWTASGYVAASRQFGKDLSVVPNLAPDAVDT